MGYLSVNKDNRLFWLGRYQERVATTLAYMQVQYDRMIDGEPFDYAAYCAHLGIVNRYDSAKGFMDCYLFNKQNPDSVAAAAEMMMNNGVVLRDTISSRTLSYLQMAVYALDRAKGSTSPMVDAQQAIDYLMAFRGSYDDYIMSENIRNIIKCGTCVERISFCLSVDFHAENVPKEIHKLLKKLEKTRLKTNPGPLKTLWDEELAEPGLSPIPKADIIRADENLFVL